MVSAGFDPAIMGGETLMLTTRETDVLQLLSTGSSYKTISRQLGISLHTVGTHVKNTYRKLEVHSCAAAVMRAVQLGLLQSSFGGKS